jgi:putative ABC transport system permease protein
VPGVSNVSFSSDVPLDGNSSAVFYTPEGNSTVTEQKRPRAYIHRVSPDFFSTMRIGIKQGRTFSPAEMSSDAKLIIVSEDVVKRYWPGENPIGKRLKMGGPTSQNPWFEIVGVVADVKYRALPRNPTPDPDIFFPLHERAEVFSLTARTQADPGQMGAALRAAVKEFDAAIPIYNVAPMRDLVGGQLAASRFAGSVMGLFAAIALLLALIGTYSVMSYVVSQSTQEIGIRMALGAQPQHIFRRVVGQGFLFGLLGTGTGVVVSLLLGRALSELLFGVSPTNPLIIGVVALLMLACTALACYVPARRATLVDPMVALRND